MCKGSLKYWELVDLEQELQGIADKLDLAMDGLGIVDQGLYESLLRQINRCHNNLNTAIARFRE